MINPGLVLALKRKLGLEISGSPYLYTWPLQTFCFRPDEMKLASKYVTARMNVTETGKNATSVFRWHSVIFLSLSVCRIQVNQNSGFFLLFLKLQTYFYFHLVDGAAVIFFYLICCGRELNPPRGTLMLYQLSYRSWSKVNLIRNPLQ